MHISNLKSWVILDQNCWELASGGCAILTNAQVILGTLQFQYHHFLVFILCLELNITSSFSGPLSTLQLFSGSVVSDSFATIGTVAHQAPLSMGFSRHKHWNGVPFPSPGDLVNPGIDPHLLHCRRILYHGATWEAPLTTCFPLKCLKTPINCVQVLIGL